MHLKPTPQALFASTSSVIDPNVITISIQPDEGISIAFDAKRPVAYETLLLDSMRGYAD